MSYTLLDNRDKDLINQDINKVSEQYNIKNKFGSSIVTNNSADFSFMGMKLYGKTTQVTTTGKNLSEVRDNIGSSNGITVNNRTEDGSVIANGTATANTAFWINTFTSTEDADIILNGIISGSASTYQLRLYDDTGTNVLIRVNDGDSEPYHVTAGTTYRVYIFVFNGATLNNVVLYPMIRLASITDPTYEPYTNGASPNPQYPQELESVGKWGNLFGGDVFADKLVEIVSATKNENTKKVSFASNNANDTTPIYGGEFKEKTPYTFIVHGQTNDANKHANLVFRYTDGTSGTLFFDTNSVDEYKVWSSDGTRTLKGIYTQYAGGITTLNYEKCGIFEGVISLDDFRPYTGQMEIESVVYGKNFVKKAATQTVRGITFAIDENGIITCNGTATEGHDYAFITIDTEVEIGQTYTLNGCPSGGSLETHFIQVGNLGLFDYGEGKTFIANERTQNISIAIAKGITVNNLVFKPMVRFASDTDNTYKPYVPKQSHLSLVTETGLKGIPVTDASLATYTDENGQMICSDVKDYTRNKNVQRIFEAEFDGSDDEAWSISAIQPIEGCTRFDLAYNANLLPKAGWTEVLCTHWKSTNEPNSISETCWCNYEHTVNFDFRILTSKFSTVEELRAFLQENPMKVQYILATPIEIPLSASEIESYKTLHSNYGVTTIMNDCDAEMEIMYAGAAYESGLTNVINKSIDNKVGDIDSKVLINGADYGIERIQIEETDGQLQLVFRAADGTWKGTINFDLAATTTE